MARMSDTEARDLFGPRSEALPKMKPPSRIKQRLIDSAVQIEADPSITYQHTVFCQTALPYRDPGAQVREWEREQGMTSLLIEAGKAKDPESGKWVELGLPFGPKPRLILCYLNAQALKTGSPMIEVEDSLTAFVKRLGLVSKAHRRVRQCARSSTGWRWAHSGFRCPDGHCHH
jgi:hypothetical protein